MINGNDGETKKKNKQSSLTDDVRGEGRMCVNEMNLLELLNKKKL